MREQVAAAMLAGRALFCKIRGILDVQYEQPIDFLLGKPFLHIQRVQGIIGLLRRLRAVVFVALPDDKIHRGPALDHRLIGAVPPGAAMQIGGEQFGPLAHHERHGLPAARVAVGIDLVRVDVVMPQEIFSQRDGLVGRGLAPVAELRGDNNHPVVVLLRGEAEVLLPQVLPHALKIQPLIPRQGEIQRIGLAPVVGFRDVDVVMDVPFHLGMEHVVQHKAAVGLRPFRDQAVIGLPRRTGSFPS